MTRKSFPHFLPKEEPAHYVPPDPAKLRVVPLGGLGSFGKNMMAFEYGDDIMLVDCGQMFPEEGMLGVDLVIPDFSYIADRLDKLRGLVLTHGHEDHIGSVPFFLRDFPDVPVYGSRLTMELVRGKIAEMELTADLHEVHPRTRITLGAFEVEFLQVTHSIPESMALAITLPIGTIIHTGDYKFDPSDESETSDFFSFSHYGETGVLLLMADSTNVDREGVCPSESSVVEGLRSVFSSAPGAVILSTFSSGLHRIQTTMTLAAEVGRQVAVAGFSLERNLAIAAKLGLIHYPEGLLVSVREMAALEPSKRLLIATGSQGERTSALSRLALNRFKGYRIGPDDTIVLSARMIPGNDRAIYRMINHFYRRGAHVVTEKDARIHASGHAYSDEMRQLYRMLKPQYFVPLHGELRQLIRNAELAAEHAVAPENVYILEDGDTFDVDSSGAAHHKADLAGQVLVDGRVIQQVEEVVLRDRKYLSEDGIVLAIFVIDNTTSKIVAGPEIVSRGFVEVDTNEDLIDDCREVARNAYEDCELDRDDEWASVKTSVRKALRQFLKRETDRFPVLLPVIIKV